MRHSTLLYRAFVLIVILTWQNIVFAQQGNYFVKKYTIKDGLPDLYILSIYQDSRGFLWVGTDNHVSRFDGKNFVNYGIRQGLSSYHINYMSEDNEGRFWVGANNKIFRFISNRFEESPLNDSLSFKFILRQKKQKDREPWILTDGGALHFEKGRWLKKTLLRGFENELCIEVIETEKGAYYNYRTSIAFQDKKGNITTLWHHEAANRGMYFNQMVMYNDTLYAATYDGIYQMTGEKTFKKLFAHCLPEKKWRGFFIDSKKRFWINEIGKAHVLIAEPGNKEHITDSLSLTIPLVSSCFEDKDHNIWIASGEGLLKVQVQNQHVYTKEKNPLLNDIRNITETPGQILYAFSREGILQLKDKNFIKAPVQFFQTGKDAINDFPDSYSLDDKNRLWFATRADRLYCLDQGKLINYSHILTKKNYLAWIDYNFVSKKLFVSADTLMTLTENRLEIFIPANKRQPVLRPSFIHCFKNGKTIFSSYSTGARMIDENDNLFNINHQLGFGESIISVRIYETRAGDFWIYGAGDGLKHFFWNKNGVPENDLRVSTDDGLPGDMVTDICMDKQNRLWVSTISGPAIITFNTQTKAIQVSPLNDHTDISDENPVNSHIYCTSDGYVWLTATNKIYKLDPRKIFFTTSKPGINIESIQLNEQNTGWKNYTDSFYGYWQMPVKPVMKYNENTLQINFTGISFTSSADFIYSYRMEGPDTTWSSPSVSNFVLFAKLLPGQYKFSVKCKTKNSDWSDAAMFSFTIKPPFWDTWWFRLVIIVIAASVIIAFYRNRVKKIEQQSLLHNQLVELEMTALKAQMNPHFIYNALNSIQALVVEERKDEAVHYIGTFSRLLRQVLENSEKNVITLQKELQTLELYINMDSLRLNMQPKFSLHINEGIQTDSEKIPPLLLQPFAENALWHGLSKKEGDKKIDMAITTRKDWLVCTIQDNGIGRAKAASLKTLSSVQYASKAIAITTRRLTDFNGDKNISPVVFEDLFDTHGAPAGTKVTLYIKRKN